MLETTITTTQSIKWALTMSGATCLIALGILAVTVYLLHEWRRDLDELKDHLERNGITDKEPPC